MTEWIPTNFLDQVPGTALVFNINSVPDVQFGAQDIYIGRAGKGQQGPFGNPFILGRDGNRETTIDKYRRWLWKRVTDDQQYASMVRDLHGKRLWCFCDPLPCHGHVLAEVAAELHEEYAADLAEEYIHEEWLAHSNPYHEEEVLAHEDAELCVLACGGRGWGVVPKGRQPSIPEIMQARKEKKALQAVLDELQPTILMHGAATGADTIAGEWGTTQGIDVWEYPAHWDTKDGFDRGAGIKRNIAMLGVLTKQRDKEGIPCMVVATTGGRGTAHMVGIAEEAGFPVRRVEV